MGQIRHDASAAEQAQEAMRRQSSQITEEEGMPEPGAEQGEDEKEKPPGSDFLSYGPDGLEKPEPEEPGDKSPSSQEPEPDSEEDADEESGEADDDTEDQEQRPRKKNKSAQARIRELTRARREAERENEQLRKMLEENQPQDQAARRRGNEDLTDTGDSGSVEEIGEPPHPKDYTYGEVDPKYIDDRTDYRVKKALHQENLRREQQQQQQQLEQRQQQLKSQWETIAQKGEQEFNDFDDVVVQGVYDGEWPLSQEMAEMILGSEVGHKVAYYLASHPDEAESVYAKTPLEQARFFGKVEARLSSPPDAPRTPKESKAPRPVQQPRGSSGKFEVSPDTDDFSAFEKRAMKELHNG